MGYLDLYIDAKEERRKVSEGKPLAGYSFTKPQEYYSGIFEESYHFEGDKIVFESGAIYNTKELEALRGLGDEAKKQLHEFKKTFGGKLNKGER